MASKEKPHINYCHFRQFVNSPLAERINERKKYGKPFAGKLRISSRIAPPCFQNEDAGQNLEKHCGATDLKIKVEELMVAETLTDNAGIRKRCSHPHAFLQNNDEIPVIAMDLRVLEFWRKTGIRVEEWWNDSSDLHQALSGFRAW